MNNLQKQIDNIDPKEIFITSDTHAWHRNIAGPSVSRWKGGYRNFSHEDEMTDFIVDEINSKVKPEQYIIHLGDVAFGKDKAKDFRARINCQNIFLLLGNHDKKHECYNHFSGVYNYEEIWVNKDKVCLFHYPIKDWNGAGRGSVHLHGHVHTKTGKNTLGRSFDVGLDNNEMRIHNLVEVVEQVKRYEIISHH